MGCLLAGAAHDVHVPSDGSQGMLLASRAGSKETWVSAAGKCSHCQAAYHAAVG